MDETTTTNSSSVAVADGASAAATTKVVGAAPTNPTPKSSSYVKLLIKASNQQFDDQVIESDLLWTVKRLKSHLSLVYPNKPPAADQKLIYSGQLLTDSLLLKDVIRSYKDVYTQNHIIHLVYTPKNLPPITSSTTNSKKSKTASPAVGANNMASEDGLRQRHTPANAGHMGTENMSQENQIHPTERFLQYLRQNGLVNGTTPTMVMPPSYAQFNMQAMAMQQAAMYNWMQQVYSQYMTQCLRVSNSMNGASEDVSGAGVAGSTLPGGFPTFPQNPFFAQFPHTVIPPPAAVHTTLAAADNQQAPQNVEPAAQQQPAQAQVAAPRFPNMPQDEPDNRDWLDNIFSITRLALFLTILYFNSSPIRCLAVVIIAGGIYLYHIGVFRLRNERNNNNLNRNNNAVQNAAVDQIRQGVDQQQPQEQQQQQEPAAENAEQPNNPIENNNGDNNAPALADNNAQQTAIAPNSNSVDSADNVADDDNNESRMSTLRTFVITFFTSLLPETPAL